MNTGKIFKTEIVKKATLAEGVYLGVYSGYEITIPLINSEIKIRTENGIRGKVDCIITVNDKGEINIQKK